GLVSTQRRRTCRTASGSSMSPPNSLSGVMPSLPFTCRPNSSLRAGRGTRLSSSSNSASMWSLGRRPGFRVRGQGGEALTGQGERLTPPPEQEQLEALVQQAAAATELEGDTPGPAPQGLPHPHVRVTPVDRCIQRPAQPTPVRAVLNDDVDIVRLQRPTRVRPEDIHLLNQAQRPTTVPEPRDHVRQQPRRPLTPHPATPSAYAARNSCATTKRNPGPHAAYRPATSARSPPPRPSPAAAHTPQPRRRNQQEPPAGPPHPPQQPAGRNPQTSAAWSIPETGRPYASPSGSERPRQAPPPHQHRAGARTTLRTRQRPADTTDAATAPGQQQDAPDADHPQTTASTDNSQTRHGPTRRFATPTHRSHAHHPPNDTSLHRQNHTTAATRVWPACSPAASSSSVRRSTFHNSPGGDERAGRASPASGQGLCSGPRP